MCRTVVALAAASFFLSRIAQTSFSLVFHHLNEYIRKRYATQSTTCPHNVYLHHTPRPRHQQQKHPFSFRYQPTNFVNLHRKSSNLSRFFWLITPSPLQFSHHTTTITRGLMESFFLRPCTTGSLRRVVQCNQSAAHTIQFKSFAIVPCLWSFL